MADKAQDNSVTKEEVNTQLLMIVNRQTPLLMDYVPELEEYDGVKVNSVCRDDLHSLMESAEADGVKLGIKTGYVSYEQQEKLYKAKLEEYTSDGDYTSVRAEAEARKLVPKAGESEAQTGLLIEFELPDDRTRAYLERSCVRFGFIQRYPKDSETTTFMAESKTLYRYVGEENALKIRSFGMTLEEYTEYLDKQVTN